MTENHIKIVECPRDAMQGIHQFIETDIKAAYINLLLQVGFDTIDFGSFVSEKAIPQLRDTAAVLEQLDTTAGRSKLLAIVANLRGVETAASFEKISYIGFPFSISETFQQRNTNSSILQSLDTIKSLLEVCSRMGKEAVVYLSMGFGNPYGDEWNAEIVEQWTDTLISEGVKILALSDTTGVSTPEKIKQVLPPILQRYPETELGIHLHSTPGTRREKLEAAYTAGCRRFDSALKGFGGCPMATDDLTGNMATEELISFLSGKGEELGLDIEKWHQALTYSGKIFL